MKSVVSTASSSQVQSKGINPAAAGRSFDIQKGGQREKTKGEAQAESDLAGLAASQSASSESGADQTGPGGPGHVSLRPNSS